MAFMKRLFLFLLTIPLLAGPGPAASSGTGEITGRLVNQDGTPMPVAVVSFFDTAKGLPIHNQGVIRIPDLVVRARPDGSFTAGLPAGNYYVGAMERAGGVGPGPPRPGEKFLFATDERNTLRVAGVLAGKTTDMGPVSGSVPDIRLTEETFFTVHGTVTREDGRPFPGVLVTAKTDPTSPRPFFMSNYTAEDGKYQILLPPGGPYYLVALESIKGGRPRPGSHIGSYGGRSPVPSPDEKTVYPPAEVGMKDGYAAGEAIFGKAGERISNRNIILYTVQDPARIREERIGRSSRYPAATPQGKTEAVK